MPTVSIVIPLYQSEATLSGCLEALRRQRFQNFEVILIDSGPEGPSEPIARAVLPAARYVRSETRLLPQSARNLGVRHASGELIAFTDPDVYARPDWLEELVAAYRQQPAALAGGVACFGRKWFDLGIHLAKFDKWLPKRSPAALEEAPSVNLIISRAAFDAIGPLRQNTIHSDTDFSWRVRAAGIGLRHVPSAVVEHHHLQGWAGYWSERYNRGRSFIPLLLAWRPQGTAAVGARLLISVLPLRLVSQLVRVGRNARAAGMMSVFWWTLPVVALGLYAWLLGEARAYAERLLEPG